MDKLSKQVEEFARNNPEITKALELFRIANDQYEASLRAMRRPEIRVSNSTDSPSHEDSA